MYGTMTAPNLLGLRDVVSGIDTLPKLSANEDKDSQGAMFFADLLNALSALKQETNQDSNEDSNTAIFANDSQSLGNLYKDAVLGLLRNQGNIAVSQNKSKDDDDNTAGSTPILPTAPVTETNTTSPSRSSAISVIFATADQNAELIDKINNAQSMQERVAYVKELRDKIVSALQKEGYNVQGLESVDKISLDGETYDVIRASKTLGKNIKVQFFKPLTGAEAEANADPLRDAILKATEDAIKLLQQISASSDRTERRELAAQIQKMVVDNLNANGHSAAAVSSPDKLIVDGVMYDFIQGLNSPGSQAQFHALKIGS